MLMSQMNARTLIAAIAALLTLALPVTASAAPNRPATPPPTDFWQDRGFMLFAHQGGERENPGNTLFAYKKAVREDGADVIDLDVTLTSDNILVATHDDQPCHTSNAPCGDPYKFRNQTLEQLRQYDFAYWFTPGDGTYYDHSDPNRPHPYRGIATGDVSPPAGYKAADFRIATFDEVLDAFPMTPVNVELKPYTDPAATAAAAAAVLAEHPGREDDVIVNSFSQSMLEAFHAAAPDHLAMGGSLEGTLSYVQGNAITPTPVAIEPPDRYNLGGTLVDTLPLLRPHFEYDGFISVVWPSDLDPDQETDAWYGKLIDQGADAINTMYPGRLHQFLCASGIRRPDGRQRCGRQPADRIPCPERASADQPTCRPLPFAQLRLAAVRLRSGKRQQAGTKARIEVVIRNSGNIALTGTRICLTVPGGRRGTVNLPACRRPGEVGAGTGRKISLKAGSSRRAKGRVRFTVRATSRNGGAATGSVATVFWRPLP